MRGEKCGLSNRIYFNNCLPHRVTCLGLTITCEEMVEANFLADTMQSFIVERNLLWLNAIQVGDFRLGKRTWGRGLMGPW